VIFPIMVGSMRTWASRKVRPFVYCSAQLAGLFLCSCEEGSRTAVRRNAQRSSRTLPCASTKKGAHYVVTQHAVSLQERCRRAARAFAARGEGTHRGEKIPAGWGSEPRRFWYGCFVFAPPSLLGFSFCGGVKQPAEAGAT
jgi:hypothetical protein